MIIFMDFMWLLSVSVESRIQDNEAKMAAMQKQIRAMFRVALYSLPKKTKLMKFDEAMQDGAEPRLSMQVGCLDSFQSFRLNRELEKVK